MSDINHSELQNKILEIFIEARKIFERHKLRYFAIGGTCLGAVRHQGFIPWDDDIDIAMPDTDYEEFLRVAPKELPPNLKMILPGTRNLFLKVHNINTTYIESSDFAHTDKFKGVFLDIMPFYGVPGNKIKRMILCSQIALIRKLDHKRRESFQCNKRFSGKVLWLLMCPVNHVVDEDFFSRIWRKTVSKYKYDNNPYTGFTWAGLSGLILDKKWYDKVCDLPFENTTMRCPENWDAYLKKHFGDYMKLPPENERVSCHAVIVDLYRTYEEYKDADLSKYIDR